MTALEQALARLGVCNARGLEAFDDAGWAQLEAAVATLDDAGLALLEAAVATDDAYEAWLAHVGACTACRLQHRCDEEATLARAYTAAWRRMHPPGAGLTWGRCQDCGALTPLVAAGHWACAEHGGGPCRTWPAEAAGVSRGTGGRQPVVTRGRNRRRRGGGSRCPGRR